MTPMMQQYREAKSVHPGMILLFRMGDFYETFEEDAETISKALGVALTSRDGHIPMAGVPAKAIEVYLRRLLQGGFRVAICDQVEEASAAKGLVKREVTRVVTPGTVTEDELLPTDRPNLLAAVCGGPDRYGLAWVDAAGGSFCAAEVRSDRLVDELHRLRPAECLVGEGAAAKAGDAWMQSLPCPVTLRPDWTVDPVTAMQSVREHFQVLTLEGFGFSDDAPSVTAAGALIHYLRETLRSSLAHLRTLRPYHAETRLRLDEVTRRSLELTRTARDGSSDGSLLAVINRTVTAMGTRLLHDELLDPLCTKDAIDRRLDAVSEFLTAGSTRTDLRDLLKDVPDLPRLIARIETNRASPRDLAAVARALRMLTKLKAKLAGRQSADLRDLEERLELFPDLRQLLDRGLADDPPHNPKDGGVIREGYDADLDELRRLTREGKTWLAEYQAREAQRTGIPNLKVGYNQVHGYFIEVTNAHSAKIPADYSRRQTLKNAERYITPELKEYEEKVLTAEERAIGLELEIFTRIRQAVSRETPRLLDTADRIARLDFLCGFAELAAQRRYVRPIITDDSILDIRDGRHPVLDQTLPAGTFVPNDSCLSAESGRFWLITGPNMAGKSVFIKQAALITLMAHVGSFVPAKSARIGIADRIFTRVGASDELNRGLSTFMVEMTEAANILNNATARSLVILDEIGRGTSTYDGVSIAWAMTEHLHDQIGCRAMFATHYHELAQLAETLEGLRNYNVLVSESDSDVVFLHRIAPGSAERSYGIHVAKLAGVPSEVLGRAGTILAELESRHQLPTDGRRRIIDPPERKRRRKAPVESGPSLFGPD